MIACQKNDEILYSVHELLFGVRRSIRYHNHRKRFFDRLHKLSTALSALSGSATIVSVLAKAGPNLTITFAAAVAIFSIIDIVIGTTQAFRLHDDLSRQFTLLEKDIISTINPNDDALAKWIAQRLDIEANEPTAMRVIDSICHNELIRALGYDLSELVEIKWYQRLFSQIIDIRQYSIKKKIEC